MLLSTFNFVCLKSKYKIKPVNRNSKYQCSIQRAAVAENAAVMQVPNGPGRWL